MPQRASIQRAISDLDARLKRLVRMLELDQALDDPDGGAAFTHVRERLGELQRQRAAKAAELAAMDDQATQPADVNAAALLDAYMSSGGRDDRARAQLLMRAKDPLAAIRSALHALAGPVRRRRALARR